MRGPKMISKRMLLDGVLASETDAMFAYRKRF